MAGTKPTNIGQRFAWRVRLVALFFGLAALVCIGRLYEVQVMHGDMYTEKADREFLAPQNPLFNRGTIYFTTKDGIHIEAATNQSGVALAVEPPKIADPEKLYEELNAIVPLSKEDFLAKEERLGAKYVVIADHLSTTTGAALEAAGLPGVVVAQDSWRYYPGGNLAAHEVGFVAYNGDNLEGRYGLEREYETTLERQNDDSYENFFVQLFADAQGAFTNTQQGDIITTIEPSVQAELERELASYVAQWHPQIAGGIIMDPETGAIYAMTSYPTFDLNNFSDASSTAVYRNPLVSNVYEMGSIMKPLTMAAGLDAGVIQPDTTYDDTGCITVDTARICNWDFKARGVIPMQQVISQSLNVGSSFIATKLGPDLMRDYFKNKYLFGQKTGIDLPNEASGLISNLDNTRQLAFDEASFGQGIAITPIEMIRALASVANGGKLVTPHLVSAIKEPTGLIKNIDWASSTVQILKPQTAEEVNQMLTVFVDQALYGGKYNFPHYSVAAKTGTAQIAMPGGGGYYSDRYLHSYITYFPAYGDHARFIIFLFAFEPQGATYSDQTWTTTFHNLVQFLINYYNIPPDR